jgi:tRNA(adenine34) deaminase
MGNGDDVFMRIAIDEAKKAAFIGEVPVGAVIVSEGEVISKAHNQRENLADPVAHAEILAIQQAAARLKHWRLVGCRLYVTKEPCPMCAGAIYQARLQGLVYGVMDIKAGAAGTLYNIVDDKRLNHQVEVTKGVLEEDCRKLLQDFFKIRR